MPERVCLVINMDDEVILTGGRMTPGVVKKGAFVHRPMCKNSPFVHEILNFMETKELPYAPYFRGVDDRNREMLTYIRGTAPANLGRFSTEQCCRAAAIIKALHDCLRAFPACPPGKTVCHNDLSPCNFVFVKEKPVAVIDWDAAAVGDPLDDLSYAVWMWLDIGNDENTVFDIRQRIASMLDAYGVPSKDRNHFGTRILGQMARVGEGIFPTEEQTKATQLWVSSCIKWTKSHLKDLY